MGGDEAPFFFFFFFSTEFLQLERTVLCHGRVRLPVPALENDTDYLSGLDPSLEKSGSHTHTPGSAGFHIRALQGRQNLPETRGEILKAKNFVFNDQKFMWLNHFGKKKDYSKENRVVADK